MIKKYEEYITLGRRRANLVEDVVVPLPRNLLHHPRLLQQVRPHPRPDNHRLAGSRLLEGDLDPFAWRAAGVRARVSSPLVHGKLQLCKKIEVEDALLI